jgi:O-antigen/teichoic acid export membrane protein
MTAFFTAPLYAGLAVVAPDLIHVALGKEWAEAAPVLSLLSVSMFVSTIGQQNTNVILIKQKPEWTFWLTVSNAIGNILALAVVGHFGMLWIAGAVAIRSVLLLPLSTACALKLQHLSISGYARALLPSIITAAAMAAFVWYLRGSIAQIPIISLAICVPSGALFYLAASWALNRTAINDLLAFAVSRGEGKKATTL